MTYYVSDIAKYIITYCANKNMPISNLKLQKLLYFIWIDYFKKQNSFLFNENICAWQFGPVVPDVYYEYCSYAGCPIDRRYTNNINNKNDCDIIDSSINKYINCSARNLVDQTHQKGSPWDIVYNSGTGLRNIIPFSLIISLECV